MATPLNIAQVYANNPITSNASTDLMYFGQSPYGITDDAAMTYANFAAQFSGPSPLTTKGDLYTFSTVNTRLAVGATNGQILQVLSSAATGLAYSTASYPATVAINTLLYGSAANVVTGLATATAAVLTTVAGAPTWAAELSLALGGTNAALTASNGGIFYSTASAGAILSGTATATQMLQSGASTAPTWSTSTWPATTTINQLLYSSSANTVVGLATATTAVLTTAAGVPTWAAELSLGLGGTNAALTASNGGIFYSTASAGAILAGTSTAGQLLTSGASTTPAWTTSTYPATNAVNTILYASSANTMAALATANSGVLVTSASGVPSISTTLPAVVTASSFTLSANGVPSCSVYNSTTTSCTASAFTKIAFQTKNWDLGTYFDATTNYRYTPLVAGTYHVSSNMNFTTGIAAGTTYVLVLYKNGSAYKYLVLPNALTSQASCAGSCLVQLNGSTDYIELFFYNGNAATAVNTSASALDCFFDIQWVGPVS